MTTSNLLEFSLCKQCINDYQNLRFNEKAILRESLIPFATIFWSDEHPSGLPEPICKEKMCFQSISLLIAARSEYWERNEISSKYADVWSTAKILIPSWPGFKRLNPSREERSKIENCFQNALDWFTALSEASNGELDFRETDSGIIEYSAKIDLKSEKEKGNLQS